MMRWIRLLLIRLFQLAANLLKGLFYVHFKLFPQQRFRIPRYAKPIIRAKGASLIPRAVWQTNYTDSVTFPVYFNYLWNRLMAPTCEHHYWVDDDLLQFIETNFSTETSDTFKKLQIGAAQADFWRALVLWKYGGVYLDVDAALCWPVVWSLENEQSELFLKGKDGHVTNFFLAAQPEHPVFWKIAMQIQKNIQENKIASLYDMTGPTVVVNIVSNEDVRIERSNLVCKQGIFVKKVFQYPDQMKNYWVMEQQNRSITK